MALSFSLGPLEFSGNLESPDEPPSHFNACDIIGGVEKETKIRL